MNKYLLRGLLCVSLGGGAVFYSIYLMNKEANLYKWVMSLGVLVFGIGFLLILYSLFRKIDRRAVLKHRQTQKRNESQP